MRNNLLGVKAKPRYIKSDPYENLSALAPDKSFNISSRNIDLFQSVGEIRNKRQKRTVLEIAIISFLLGGIVFFIIANISSSDPHSILRITRLIP